jgi:KUP system potassium uptake protein
MHTESAAPTATVQGTIGRETLRAAVVVGALGVVFGDIGTSPIYTIQTVFNPTDPHPVPISPDNVFGVVSLVFWSAMIIVTLTYVTLVMRASNEGEGGIMALITLLSRWGGGNARSRRRTTALAALGILGAALFFGDSMITPAISVLSAVEGIKVIEPSLEELVVPLTAVIIVLLFAVQRRGTAAVGRLFGPVMIAWFVAIGACGVAAIVAHPRSCRRSPRPTLSASWPGTSAWPSSRSPPSCLLSPAPRRSTPTWATSDAAPSPTAGSGWCCPRAR